MLGEVVGGDEGENVGLEAIEGIVVKGFDRGVFDRSVHALGLTIGPWMVGLGEPVLDIVLAADAVEAVATNSGRWSVSILWQVGEWDTVVGQDSVNPVRECGHDTPEESRSGARVGSLVKLYVGKLRDPIDGEKHVKLAIGKTQFTRVNVDVTDPRLGEAPALHSLLFAPWQARDAVPLQAAMQSTTGELRDGLPKAAEHVIQWQQRVASELNNHRFLDLRKYRAVGIARSHRSIDGRGALPPLGDRLRVQAVPRRKGPGAFLRRLELGSNTRRRSGAAVKNICHNASSS